MLPYGEAQGFLVAVQRSNLRLTGQNSATLPVGTRKESQ